MDIEFRSFPKIPRFSRPCIVTEKLDGTNASICITEEGHFLTGSRNGWITPEKDNYGFSRWAHQHKDELLTLGVGHHFGEWWGNGIQRNYGLKEKRFSLFNVSRWVPHGYAPGQLPTEDPRYTKSQEVLPPCVGLVPVLGRGTFGEPFWENCLLRLQTSGSAAVPGFMKPEGIVIYHVSGGVLFKKTIEKDEVPKTKG